MFRAQTLESKNKTKTKAPSPAGVDEGNGERKVQTSEAR